MEKIKFLLSLLVIVGIMFACDYTKEDMLPDPKVERLNTFNMIYIVKHKTEISEIGVERVLLYIPETNKHMNAIAFLQDSLKLEDSVTIFSIRMPNLEGENAETNRDFYIAKKR